MLIKKFSLKFLKYSYYNDTPDVKKILMPVLKKLNVSHLYLHNINYNEYFGKVTYSIVNKTTAYFLKYEDRKSLVLRAYVEAMSEKVIKKFLKTSKDQLGLEKYIARALDFRLRTHLKNEQKTFNNKKVKNIDHVVLDGKTLLDLVPSNSFNKKVEDSIDFDVLVKELNSYIDKKYFRNPESKVIVKKIFNGLVNGKSIKSFGKEFNIGGKQLSRYLDMLKEIILSYSKSSKNKALQSMIETINKNKKSISEDFLSEFFSVILKNSKKVSKLIRIKKIDDILTEEYIVSNTLSPDLTSSDLKESIKNYLSNFDDLTDVVDEGDFTYAIKSFN